MKVIEKKEIKEFITKTYIAEDGKEFFTEIDCETYEKQMIKNQRKEHLLSEATKFFIDDAEGFLPFNGEENYKHRNWFWYKIDNQSQIDTLNELYDLNIGVSQFPEFVCVEEDECEEYHYETYLKDSIDYVKELFIKLGIEGEITIKI